MAKINGDKIKTFTWKLIGLYPFNHSFDWQNDHFAAISREMKAHIKRGFSSIYRDYGADATGEDFWSEGPGGEMVNQIWGGITDDLFSFKEYYPWEASLLDWWDQYIEQLLIPFLADLYLSYIKKRKPRSKALP